MTEALINYKLMRVLKECPHCNARQVGGRVYMAKEQPIIAARWLYECGHDEEQLETGVKNVYHSCGKGVDKAK